MSAEAATTTAPPAAIHAADAPVAATPAVAAEPTSAVTAPESQPASTEAAATTAAPAAVADASASKEEPLSKDEVEVTATPVSAGTLGYKAPGLMNQLRFKKHYFWLGDETAVPHSELAHYLGSKEADKHTAAHSSHTGKGLLYFKEGESTKSKPQGIINLAQVELSTLAKSADKVFTFTVNKGRHTFEAASADERNGWVVAIKSEIEAAIANKDTVSSSSGYKSALSELEGPAAGAAVVGGAGAAAATAPHGDKTDERLAKKEEKSAKKPKDRSVSRKRQSMFGGLLGKKEDAEAKKEEKKEDKQAKKEEKAAEKEEKKEEKAAEKEEEKEEKETEKKEAAAEKEIKKEEKAAEKEAKEEDKAEAKAEAAHASAAEHADNKELSAASAAGVAAAAGVTAEEVHKNSAKTDKSSKRGSVFGSFFNKNSPSMEKKQEEVVPATIDENAAPATTATTATEPTATEPKVEEAGVVGATGAAPAALAAEETKTKPEDQKRRSSFFGLGGKKDKKAVEEPKSEATAAKESEAAEVAATGEAAKVEEKETPTKKSPLDFIRRKTKSGSKDAPKNKGGLIADPLPKVENAHPSTIEQAKEEAAEHGETLTAPVAETATAEGSTADAVPKVNGTNSAIGDVVPEAVTIGEKPAVETNGPAPVQATV